MRFDPKDFDAEVVNILHLNADKDAGAGALHHTLGLGPTQASPGSHRHNGRDSYRIKLSDLQGETVSYQPLGGTLGTQPTFDGDPLITGSYTKYGNMVFFQIDVDFDNILTFGTGQYYLTLPFVSEHALLTRDGCLHDFSTGAQYAISAHVDPDSNQLMLFSVGSNGRDIVFDDKTPITLDTTDNFHIAGTYEIKQ